MTRRSLFLGAISTLFASSSAKASGWRIGRISHFLTPGFGWCGRCLTTWKFVEGHATYFLWCDEVRNPRDASSGMFPLCEQCWSDLTPAERLPYYRELNMMWARDGDALPDTMIERSVLLEGQGPAPYGGVRLFTQADGTSVATTSLSAVSADDPILDRWWCRKDPSKP